MFRLTQKSYFIRHVTAFYQLKNEVKLRGCKSKYDLLWLLCWFDFSDFWFSCSWTSDLGRVPCLLVFAGQRRPLAFRILWKMEVYNINNFIIFRSLSWSDLDLDELILARFCSTVPNKWLEPAHIRVKIGKLPLFCCLISSSSFLLFSVTSLISSTAVNYIYLQRYIHTHTKSVL